MNSNSPDPRTPPTGPTHIPRGSLPGTTSTVAAVDACVNFNLPDSRVVCLSVPVGITAPDAEFILTLLQAHVTAIVRRGR
jgi:hypothetical protein